MDSFSLFNIGFGELFFILLLAGLVMGPQRIRVVARSLGQMTAKLRGISTQFMRQLNNELDGSEREDLKGAIDDIRNLQRELRDLRSEIYSVPKAAMDEGRKMHGQSKNGADVGEKQSGISNRSENNMAGSLTTGLPSVLDIDDDPE